MEKPDPNVDEREDLAEVEALAPLWKILKCKYCGHNFITVLLSFMSLVHFKLKLLQNSVNFSRSGGAT